MATPRYAEHRIDTSAGPVTVHLAAPGGAGRVPVVLVPGMPATVGPRVASRLARAGFAVAWWEPAAAAALDEAALRAAAGIAPWPVPAAVVALCLPGVPHPSLQDIEVVAWPGAAPDPGDVVTLDATLDEVVPRLAARFP